MSDISASWTPEELRERGYFLLPIPYGKKSPPPTGWVESEKTYEIPEGSNVAIGTKNGVSILITNDDESTKFMTETFGEPNVRSHRGAHWYFRKREGQVNEANKKTAVGTMEFHCYNKYAMIPPSLHPSGTRYEWVKPLPPVEELPEAPDLTELFHPSSEKEVEKEVEKEFLGREHPPGTHHDELLKYSAHLAGKGRSEDEIFDALKKLRDEFPDPEKHPDKELQGMASSAYKKFHKESSEKERKKEEFLQKKKEAVENARRRFGKAIVKDDTTGEPTRIVLWNEDGMPAVLSIGERITESLIPFKNNHSKWQDGLINHVKRLKGESGEILILLDDEVFKQEDFLNIIVDPQAKTLMRHAMEALPLDDEVVYSPSFRETPMLTDGGELDDFLVFPRKPIAFRDTVLQREYVKSLNIGSSDTELVGRAFDMLRKYPKQWSSARLIVGANVANLLGIEDFPYSVSLIGDFDSGKSFCATLTLKICYGISTKLKLQDDAINSEFRHHATMASTNLPIYIEEAKIKDKSVLKSRGKNIRGRKDQSFTIYDVNSTLVLSQNTDNDTLDPVEEKAERKRILRVHFDDSDIIRDRNVKAEGNRFLLEIEKKPFDLLYQKLEEKPIRILRDKYLELKTKYEDPREFVVRFAEYILDLEQEPVDFGEEKERDEIQEFEATLYSLYERGNRLSHHWYRDSEEPQAEFKELEKWEETILNEFKISGMEFWIFNSAYEKLRRQYHWKTTANMLSRHYQGKKSNNVSIGGRKAIGIKGTFKHIGLKEDGKEGKDKDTEDEISNEGEVEGGYADPLS